MPAMSKSQQRLFGMVHAYKQGKLKKAPKKIKDVAKHISDEDARDFAKTKSNGLPEKKAHILDGYLGILKKAGSGSSVFSAIGNMMDTLSSINPEKIRKAEMQERYHDDIDRYTRWLYARDRKGQPQPEYPAPSTEPSATSFKPQKEPVAPISSSTYGNYRLNTPTNRLYDMIAKRSPWDRFRGRVMIARKKGTAGQGDPPASPSYFS